jgi:hypothetical protein
MTRLMDIELGDIVLMVNVWPWLGHRYVAKYHKFVLKKINSHRKAVSEQIRGAQHRRTGH